MGGKPKQLNDRNATIWVANDVYSPPFHGGNTGSNPEGSPLKNLTISMLYISPKYIGTSKKFTMLTLC